MRRHFFAIAITVILLLSPILILSTQAWFYETLYKVSLSQMQEPFTQEQRNEATEILIGYLAFERDDLEYTVQGKAFYSEQAIFHLGEVRDIFRTMTKVIMALVVVLTAGLLWKKDFLSFRLQLRYVLGSLLVLGVGAVFFEKAFIIMHKIFFNNDLWLFPADDNLIILLPEKFFFLFFVCSLAITLITSVLLYLLGRNGYDKNLHRS